MTARQLSRSNLGCFVGAEILAPVPDVPPAVFSLSESELSCLGVEDVHGQTSALGFAGNMASPAPSNKDQADAEALRQVIVQALNLVEV